ncbi:MAG: hypothetical protein ACE5HJ_03605 [Thermoplasmata archaeon]
MGEEKSVLRWGGIAGILAGIILLIFGLVGLGLALMGQIKVVPDLEQYLVDFHANPIPVTVFLDLAIVSVLLLFLFVVALYWTLREPSRVFARIGLGLGVLALILLAVSAEVDLLARQFFSLRYANAAPSDQPTVAAIFAALHGLTTAGLNIGLIFLGVGFIAFGLAMRASLGYQEGFVWLSAILGLVIILLPLLILNIVSLVFIGLLGLVLGWKVYSLSRA